MSVKVLSVYTEPGEPGEVLACISRSEKRRPFAVPSSSYCQNQRCPSADESHRLSQTAFARYGPDFMSVIRHRPDSRFTSIRYTPSTGVPSQYQSWLQAAPSHALSKTRPATVPSRQPRTRLSNDQ